MVKDRWGLRRAEAFFSRANRVTFETMAADFYTRLGVDPKAERAEIEAALKRKQPNWSMGTRNPKTRHEFQRYLDEIPALKRALLSDAASRAGGATASSGSSSSQVEVSFGSGFCVTS